MPQEKAEALVLRGVDYSETSRIITFLTPERGRLTCIAKGVRRKNSPLAPMLDTFNRVELIYYWKEGRGIHTLGEISLLHSFPGIKNDLERGCFGAVPLELASRIAHDNEPSHEFYATLLFGLRQMEGWNHSARLHCAWQLARLLVVAGFAPALTHCVQCGGKIGHNPGFDLDGGALCGQCPAEQRITRQVYENLVTLFDDGEQCPDITQDGALFRIVRAYMIRQTETDFRSLRVLHDMFGS